MTISTFRNTYPVQFINFIIGLKMALWYNYFISCSVGGAADDTIYRKMLRICSSTKLLTLRAFKRLYFTAITTKNGGGRMGGGDGYG